MDLLHDRVAGLDVHKDVVAACVRITEGRRVERHAARFGTTTSQLLALGEWLRSHGVTHVAMEATGVYWRPVWHVLEEDFTLVLAHAREVRNLPGRKSDTSDAAWLADLVAHGLIRGSFVPTPVDQELRDLTRTRRQLSREAVQHVQRIQKLLEDANCKLSSVLADTLGLSGRRILDALVAGESDPEQLASQVHHRVHASREQIVEALRGRVTDHHRFLLRSHLSLYDTLQASIQAIETRIEAVLDPLHQAAVQRLTEIPGLSRTAAHVIVAEIGIDMSRFPTAGHLVSWAGLCPRMDESAGKRRSTRVRSGNAWLKPVLVQAAWAAARTKNSYLRSFFHGIKVRRGAKKAAVATAATLLTIAYHMLREGTCYQDLGARYLDQRKRQRTVRRLLGRLHDLGLQVQVTEREHAA